MAKQGHEVLENVKIIFPNFAGRPDKYNKQGGKLYFTAELSKEQADKLAADGWNVKWPEVKEDEDPYPPRIKVNLPFKGYTKPLVYIRTSRGNKLLDEETIDLVDGIILEGRALNVDLIIRPFVWDEDTGAISAYLQSMYVTIEENILERKYAEMDA